MTWNPDNQYVTKRLERFYELDDALPAAYKSGDALKVKALAAEYLDLAAIYRCNWNYGNAIHDANRYLGLVSLKAGDVDQAAAYLVAAGKSTGSPQLDTFGPDMGLANALLHAGKTDAVKTYLIEIKTFWTMDNGRISLWLREIDLGKQPNLDPTPHQVADIMGGVFSFIVWAAFAWPAVIAVVFLYVKRARIDRKVWYFLSGASLSYLTMLLADLGTGFGLIWIASRSDNPSLTILLALSLLSFLIVAAMPIVSMLWVARFFQSPRGEGL